MIRAPSWPLVASFCLKRLSRETCVPDPSNDTARVEVSIVVPTYGQSAQLRTLLVSLEGLEPAPPFEVVVVNDCSPDETDSVVREWRAQTHSFPTRYVRLERNVGPAAARNAGTARARGGIVVYTDSDCRIDDKAWLGKLIRKLDAEAGVMGVGGAVLPLNPKGFFARYNTVNRILEPTEDLNYLVTGNCCCYRDRVLEVGGFDEDVLKPGGEDIALSIKMVHKGWRFAFEPEAAVLHDYREGLRNFIRTWKNYAYGCGYVIGKYFAGADPEPGAVWHKDSIRPLWLWPSDLRIVLGVQRRRCKKSGVPRWQCGAFLLLRVLQLCIHYEYFRRGEAVFAGRARWPTRCTRLARRACAGLVRACCTGKRGSPG